MEFARIRPNDIQVGKALPWDVYNTQGKLLLGKGYVVSSDNQAGRLLQDGVFADARDLARTRAGAGGGEAAPSAPPPSTAQLISLCRKRLDQTYQRIVELGHSGQFVNRIDEIAGVVSKACDLNPHVAQAMILLRQDSRFPIRHMVNTAVVVRLVARAMRLPAASERSAVAAALTMNFGMVELQEMLNEQLAPLSQSQREALERHPEEGASLLASIGVTDPVWLTAVRQHHEFIDGTGYPAKLSGAAVSREAQLLGLADLFCARITPRAYRPAVASNAALRGILLDRGKSVDPEVAAYFIRALGVFPPGMLVKLANGEIAVVAEPGEKTSQPVVASVIGPQGDRLTLALRRDTSQEHYAIKETVDPKQFSTYVNMEAIWGSAAVISHA